MTDQNTTTAKGRVGEDIAVQRLERDGYVVIGRNVRAGRAEIDVVARDGEVLCFIEVRRRESLDDALRSIDGKKQARIVKGARNYLLKVLPTPQCRFDVVVVAGNRTEVFKNAFVAAAP